MPGNGGGAVFVNKAMIKFFKKHWEVISYLIFGVLTTLLNIVLYALFNRLFGYTAANSWGNVLDNILCILFAYATNRAFVFNSKTRGRAMAKEFGAFVTCRLGTMLLDTAIMLVLGNLLAAQGAALMEGLLTGIFTHLHPETLVGMTAVSASSTAAGASVAVIGGGMVGCETAEYLAARGCKVSVIEMMDKIAAGESTTILPTLLENYKTYGVEQYPSHKVKEFRMDAVVCENKDGAEVTIPCDYIVLAMGARSNEFDAAALEASSIPVYSIGDAAGKAADISNAIRTGYDTACQL